MRLRLLAYAAVLLFLAQPAWAVDIDLRQSDGTKTPLGGIGPSLKSTLTELISGENQSATGANASGVMTVEFNYLTTSAKTADYQVKASAGFIHNIVCIGTDALATVGTIKIYDSLTETGTELFSWTTVAVALNTQPLVFPIDAAAATGIYLGYTTIADIQCTVSYR